MMSKTVERFENILLAKAMSICPLFAASTTSPPMNSYTLARKADLITDRIALWIRFLTLVTGLCFSFGTLHSAVIFSEKFTNTLPSGNMYLSNFGWSGYQGTTAQTLPTSLAYIPQNLGNPNTDKGYLAFVPSTAGTFAAVKTFSSMDAAGGEFTWSMGNTVTTATVRLLVKVGANWYASSSEFKNTSSYTATTFASTTTADVRRSLVFSTAAANWRSFTLTPGSVMSLGAVLGSNLTSSQITGIGFYVTTPAGSSVVRLDSLEIDSSSLPPGAAALGYTTCVYDVLPTTADIAPAPNSTGNYQWFRGACWSPDSSAPPANNFTNTNGVLTILRDATHNGGSLVGAPHNFSEGALPTLPGEDGFYIEFDVRLSGNNIDHWPAVWLMPVEHNGGNGQPVGDIYPGDPAGYERWMELDVDEGGFGMGSLGSVIDWRGKWSGGTFFTENFTNTLSTGNMYLSDFGWSGYQGATAQTLSTAIAYIPQNLGNPNTAKGYLALTPSTTGTFAAVKTLPSRLDVAGCVFKWSMGNTVTTANVRLLVKVGANWYASSDVFSNTSTYTAATFASGTTADVRRSLTFSKAKANWRSFTLTPASVMSLGAVLGSDLTSSEINAIGFYVTTPAGSSVVRLDSLQVTMAGYNGQTYNSWTKAQTALDRTQVHTFGASYDPIQSRVTWWLDGVQYFTADASHVPAIAAIQNFYPIISNQSHNVLKNPPLPAVPYSMYIHGVRAYVPPAREPLVTTATLGTVSSSFTRWQGGRITVGSSNITVTELGRMMAAGNTGSHTIKLVSAATGQDLPGGSVSVNLTYWRAGQFKYGKLATPVVLQANQIYYVVSNETAGGNSWHNEQTQVTTTSAVSAIRPVWGNGPGTWNMLDTPGRQFGPMDIKYLVAP